MFKIESNSYGDGSTKCYIVRKNPGDTHYEYLLRDGTVSKVNNDLCLSEFYHDTQELAQKALNAYNNKSAFKVGDRVCALENAPDQFTKGNVYTITGIYSWGGLQMLDDAGIENGWSSEFFELVTDDNTDWVIKDFGYVINPKLGRFYITKTNTETKDRDFLYPDGSIHDTCHVNDSFHGWYQTKAETEKVLNKHLSPKTYEDGWNDAINHMQSMLDNMKNKV